MRAEQTGGRLGLRYIRGRDQIAKRTDQQRVASERYARGSGGESPVVFAWRDDSGRPGHTTTTNATSQRIVLADDDLWRVLRELR